MRLDVHENVPPAEEMCGVREDLNKGVGKCLVLVCEDHLGHASTQHHLELLQGPNVVGALFSLHENNRHRERLVQRCDADKLEKRHPVAVRLVRAVEQEHVEVTKQELDRLRRRDEEVGKGVVGARQVPRVDVRTLAQLVKKGLRRRAAVEVDGALPLDHVIDVLRIEERGGVVLQKHTTDAHRCKATCVKRDDASLLLCRKLTHGRVCGGGDGRWEMLGGWLCDAEAPTLSACHVPLLRR